MDEPGSMDRKILRYMIEHPDAMDAAEGVRKWWLPKGRVESEAQEVQEALDLLVSKGWLITRKITFSQKIYGINHERFEEVKALLRRLENNIEGDDI